jgi:hypothetical protein
MSAGSLRRQVLLSTTMLVGSLTGYGRSAYANCHTNPPTAPAWLCENANTVTQNITGADANNATVTTAAGFSVNAASGNALTITGLGALSYTDENASALTSAAAIALAVQSNANLGSPFTLGSVTIDTNGALTGFTYGIRARNYGNGAITITADGA